ncbi:hypothetical protein BJ944DRAFT_75585 [Cunninghamella echinulata]|nr:hypothetical protein BJ944DRAFT_75585 [Cunninghamella echinulata]
MDTFSSPDWTLNLLVVLLIWKGVSTLHHSTPMTLIFLFARLGLISPSPSEFFIICPFIQLKFFGNYSDTHDCYAIASI